MSKIPSSFFGILNLLGFFFLILLPLVVHSKQVNNVTEQQILLEIKQQWGNPPSLISWNSSSPSAPCDWLGIHCYFTCVSMIVLNFMHIHGEIPPTICHLQDLRSISFSNNNITGNVRQISRCSMLETIDFSTNFLTGSIPNEFGNLFYLTHLDLSWNSLTGSIPAALFLPHKLEFLSLQHNRLSGHIPADFGTLHRLKSLGLSGNYISGDILKIVNTAQPSITEFLLCSNKISGKVSYDFVSQRFINFCLDDSNLCSDNKNIEYSSCNHTPKLYGIIMIFCGTGSGVIGLLIIVFYARKLKWKRTKENNVVVDEWEMIVFRRIGFTKWDIVSNLNDNNVIGRGGSGEVYRFAISQTGKAVAVKKICSKRKSKNRLEKEFLAEVEILGLIRHSNIVKLFCCIFSNNTKLLVYEYLENQSLDLLLHRTKRSHIGNSSIPQFVLDWPKRLQIAIGAAQGLCYMHHDCLPPVLHRDVKSSNILLDSEFNGKIADFGLAKLLVKRGQPETASAIAGTFGYIAPEYASTSKVNEKSDIYSFGVVLLEMTTGRPAVNADETINLAQWAHRHVAQEGSSIVDALDDEIKEEYHLRAMTSVFILGLKCTAQAPLTRPSMKIVQQILQSCVPNFPSQG